MADYKCPMITVGIIHIIDGLLLPILWGLGWLFNGYVSLYAAPVWGGIVFLIPAGITGIMASSGNNVAARVCRMFNGLGAVAATAVIVTAALIASTNIATDSDAGAVGLAIATAVLGVLEVILCFLAGLYSSRILDVVAAMQVAPVVYSGGGVDNPAMQYPGAQVQLQYPAQPVQGQYPGAPDQGQYPGAPDQGQYPGPPAQGQYPGPAQGQNPGSPAQGQYPGPAQGQYPGTTFQGQYTPTQAWQKY